MAMFRRIHGSNDHSSVAVSLCRLAQVYEAQGRLAESAALHEESLAMRRQIHGSKDHIDVATSLCHLAQLYKAPGRLAQSAMEALAMLRRIHGGDHSDVATSLCHLALVYEAQGQLDDSEAARGVVGDAAADPCRPGPQVCGYFAAPPCAPVQGSRSNA